MYMCEWVYINFVEKTELIPGFVYNLYLKCLIHSQQDTFLFLVYYRNFYIGSCVLNMFECLRWYIQCLSWAILFILQTVLSALMQHRNQLEGSLMCIHEQIFLLGESLSDKILFSKLTYCDYCIQPNNVPVYSLCVLFSCYFSFFLKAKIADGREISDCG